MMCEKLKAEGGEGVSLVRTGGWGGGECTVVIEMVAHLHVSVAAGGDVEVALDLVELQAPVDATAVGRVAPQPRRLAPAGALASERDDIVDVLLAEALVVRLLVPFARDGLAVRVLAQLVDPPVVGPLRPARRVLLEPRGGEDAVAGRVLDVDV